MAGRAIVTTVASSIAIPDPSTVATSTHRPAAVPSARPAGAPPPALVDTKSAPYLGRHEKSGKARRVAGTPLLVGHSSPGRLPSQRPARRHPEQEVLPT